MNDDKKTPEKISGRVAAIRDKLVSAKANVLLGMSEKHPRLRLYLTGGEQGDGIAPAGTISIQIGPFGVSLLLRIPALLVEARYDLVDWYGMWDIIESDMVSGATPWVYDYNAKKKEQARYSDLA